MPTPDANDAQVAVPRWSGTLWSICTVVIVAAYVYGFSAHGASWSLTAFYIFFMLPIIYGVLALVAEALSARSTKAHIGSTRDDASSRKIRGVGA